MLLERSFGEGANTLGGDKIDLTLLAVNTTTLSLSAGLDDTDRDTVNTECYLYSPTDLQAPLLAEGRTFVLWVEFDFDDPSGDLLSFRRVTSTWVPMT